MSVAAETHTLYLAGPMTGYPAYNFAAFDAARTRLRSVGYVVICPAELDREAGFNPEVDAWTPAHSADAARRDLRAIALVDAVAVLPGFRHSTGARVELTAARWIGLPVVAADDPDIDITLSVDNWLADAWPTPLELDDAGALPADRRAQMLAEIYGLDDVVDQADDEAAGIAEALRRLDAINTPASPRRLMLDDAANLVDGDRNNQYGDPRQDFRRTAELWTTYLDGRTVLELHDVAALMALLKLSRIRWSPDRRDSWVDLAGYAACGWDCARPDETDE